MKKDLTAGLIILLPIALTIYIVVFLFDFMTNPFVGLIEKFIVAYEKSEGIDLSNHDILVTVISRIIILFTMFLLILVLGFIARKFFFQTGRHRIHRVLLSHRKTGDLALNLGHA